MRILQKWGLDSYLERHVVEPESITFRRWQDGSPIGFTRLIPDFRQKYHAPYYVVHRADFHGALHKLALQYGVKVILNAKVTRYHEATPKVLLADGKSFRADLIVAADGKSGAPRLVMSRSTDTS